MDKEQIIGEIQRTALGNGGKPLGRLRLDTVAGIKEHHWKKYWAKFSDAQREAGFTPNVKTQPYSEEVLIGFLVDLCRELARFPTNGDLRVKAGKSKVFPSDSVFSRRFGSKANMVNRVRQHCEARADLEDLIAICQMAQSSYQDQDEAGVPNMGPRDNDGFVYLMKSGPYYKIGKTNHVGRRERDLAILLPQPIKTVHSIKTDDPDGIEAYWHRRFSDKRKNGEWFELNRADIIAFRRRRFM